MPGIIQFNPSDSNVPGRIVARRIFKVESPVWQGLENVVVDPEGFTMADGHYKWDGLAMIECTESEAAAIEAAQQEAADASDKAEALERLIDQKGVIFHIVRAMVEEFHAHVADPSKTVGQLKQAIKNNAEDGINGA